jgi:phosphoglucomutase
MITMSVAQKRYEHWLNHSALDDKLRQELIRIQDSKNEIENRFFTSLTFGTGGMRGEMGAGTNRMNLYTVRKAAYGLAQYLLNQNSTFLNMVASTTDEESSSSPSSSAAVSVEAEKRDTAEKSNIAEKSNTTEQSNATEQSNTAERLHAVPSVVIAYDCRHDSATFAEQAALTLAEQGIAAYVFADLRPTPQLSFAVRKLQASAGIVITASHNPPEYNGFKVYGEDGAQLNLEEADRVIGYVEQVEDELAIPVMAREEAERKQLFITLGQDMDERYADYVVSINERPDLIREMADEVHIVFTPFHGTALEPVQRVLNKAGFKQVHIVSEQARPDPDFSTVASPNPEEHEAFRLAIQLAEKVNANIILGTDPDADRMGVVVRNDQGEYTVLTGNQTGALFIEYLIRQKKLKGTLTDGHTLCKTIVTSELGASIAKAHGIETMNTLTGFKFIGELIKQFRENGDRTFLFGYEESYGYLIGDEVRDKDAVQAVLLAAEMAAYCQAEGITLYDMLQDIYEKYGFYREELISITLKGKEGLGKIRGFMDLLHREQPERLADGRIKFVEDYAARVRREIKSGREQELQLPASNVLKYFMEDGTWLCVRPSGTEPKLKIYIGVTGSSRDEAEAKRAHYKREIGSWTEQLLQRI